MTALRKLVLDGETYLLVPADDEARTIAEVFCEMDDYEQAEFFEHVGNISTHWPQADTQWCAMVGHMSIGGEDTLRSMAQFLEKADD